METWYNKLGFYNNPFSTKPAAYHDDVLGYEETINEIIEKTSNGTIIGIFGEYGTGKTTILKRLIREFGGRRNVIYLNCNKTSHIDFEKIVKKASNIFQRIFKIKKKNLILMLDETQDFPLELQENLYDYYKAKYFKTVILVSKKEDLFINGDITMEMLHNVYNLGKITNEQAIELIRKRIEGIDILNDEMIIKIFHKNKNPRAFLKNCEEVCRYSVEKEKDIDEDLVDLILK
ncbi:MAG: ATP-binding protein [Candidatus Nanoarchaeia archaeon]|nr:ATP-binding protein [Candidatus Nanoarchaeia archaeon]